ncbi:MAG TPA: chromate efflux transporter [Myxococcaceae bacterium]|nr:chromate efflux transporter [Myxococcaceae bacterium]
MADEVAAPTARASLREVAVFFLRLGATAFGGPAAHISMMEKMVVRERRWLTREKFLDLLGAANMLPGPSSTELAIYIGYEQAGFAGLLLGGTCFILPAALLTLGIAWLYVRMGTLPQVGGVLYGIKPVIIVVIAEALWHLARAAVKTWLLAFVGLLAVAAALVGVNPLLILLASGAALLMFQLGRRARPGAGTVAGWSLPAAAGSLAGVGMLPLFLTFAKIGAVVFGSGYVLLAFLRADLVDRLHWLTEAQLLDAVAVGQFTPGPVFTTATFIGYLLGGIPGALAATAGIFAPAFVLVAISGPLVPRLRRSSTASAFLDGVNVASLGLMAAVTWQLGRAALVDLPTIAIALAGAVLLFRFRVNSAWLVLGGGAIGLAISH